MARPSRERSARGRTWPLRHSLADVETRRRERRRRAVLRRRVVLAAGLALAVSTPLALALRSDGEAGEPQPARQAAASPPPLRTGPPGASSRRASRREPPPPRAPGAPGSLVVVPGRSGVLGSGDLRRFLVRVEGGLAVDRGSFARLVEQVLADERGWGGTGRFAFQRVDGGTVSFTVTLASPAMTDSLCAPLPTNGIFSCGQGSRAVLNFGRWRDGAAAYGRDLFRYRVYMINHEVGHILGRGHASCPGSGRKAPVMMQQTKGVAPCRPNPWPLAAERW